ncbi:hypothetical protein ACFOGG_17705 [Brenneria rubrifaciens]
MLQTGRRDEKDFWVCCLASDFYEPMRKFWRAGMGNVGVMGPVA